MKPLHIAALVGLSLAVLWQAQQLYRIGQAVITAWRNIEKVKASGEHQAKIRLFVEAQSKLMRMDATLGAVFAVGIVLCVSFGALLTVV